MPLKTSTGILRPLKLTSITMTSLKSKKDEKKQKYLTNQNQNAQLLFLGSSGLVIDTVGVHPVVEVESYDSPVELNELELLCTLTA